MYNAREGDYKINYQCFVIKFLKGFVGTYDSVLLKYFSSVSCIQNKRACLKNKSENRRRKKISFNKRSEQTVYIRTKTDKFRKYIRIVD